MSRITLEEIKKRVVDAAEHSILGPSLRGVDIEPDDLDPETLLRVTIALHRPDKIDVTKAREFRRRLQLDMMADDDRFLVVSFAEAA